MELWLHLWLLFIIIIIIFRAPVAPALLPVHVWGLGGNPESHRGELRPAQQASASVYQEGSSRRGQQAHL